jgi:5-hydroxyisourate hydrolase
MSVSSNPGSPSLASPITTHILDTAQGRPAGGVAVVLEQQGEAGWIVVGGGTTDADGRLRTLLEPDKLGAGNYRLIFETGAYFAQQGVAGFYPQAIVVFAVREPSQHYHVPLLLSPFGYSTYRGS